MFPAIDHHPQLVAGRYQLLAKIGTGGMGTVWQASDQLLGRTVALKRVRLDVVDPLHVAVTRERTMREARIAAALHHPNIVSIFDIVIDDDEPWLVMEYVPARTLAELLAEHTTLPWADVAAIGAQISAALAAAHHAGIVHRDVKPNNILITRPGPGASVKLTDFGISHATGSPAITSTGVLTGTPAYFAPETARTGETGPASDVYSLCATLYAATEGFPPFGDAGTNPLALLNRIATTDLPPPRNAGPLAGLIQHLTARHPTARPSAAQAHTVLHDVAMHLHHGGRSPTLVAAAPRRRRGRKLLLAGAVLLTALAVAAAAVVVIRERSAGPSAGPLAAPPSSTAAAPPAAGGPRTVDPCALIDVPALTNRFGPTSYDSGYEDFAECAATITIGAETVTLFVEPETAAQAGSKGIGLPTGTLPQITNGAVRDDGVCGSRLFLDTNTSVETVVVPPESTKLDPCAIASFAASSVEAILRGGMPQRQLDSASALSGLEACALLTPADVAPAAPASVVQYAGYAQWTCIWQGSATTVELVFARKYRFRSDDRQSVIGDHIATTESRDGGGRCVIAIMQRFGTAAGAYGGRIEVAELRLFGSEPETDLCTEATRLATVVESRLPPPT